MDCGSNLLPIMNIFDHCEKGQKRCCTSTVCRVTHLYAPKVQQLSAELRAGLGLQQPPLVVTKLRTVALLRVQSIALFYRPTLYITRVFLKSENGCVHGESHIDTFYHRGTPLFFLILPLDLGAQDLSKRQNLIRRKINLLYRG